MHAEILFQTIQQYLICRAFLNQAPPTLKPEGIG